MIEKSAKIVACYIVQNEEENLRKSLESVKDAVDEIVVVDTGSLDDTVKIAKNFGAKVFFYDWNDDFAAARNFCLDRLTGDWAVFLDADEYFDKNTSMNLRPAMERQSNNVNLLLINRHDIDEQGQVMLSIYVPRIFRINPSLRYIGAIHEELRQDGKTVSGIKAVKPTELMLIHTGYAGKLGDTKAKRNLKILLKEFETAKDPERLYGYMAEAYDGLGDRQNAMKYALLDIEGGRKSTVYASRSYRLLLAKLTENPADNEARKMAAVAATSEYPELPEFYAEYAEALAVEKNYLKAIKAMKQALFLGEHYKGIEPTVFNEEMKAIWQKRIILWESLING